MSKKSELDAAIKQLHSVASSISEIAATLTELTEELMELASKDRKGGERNAAEKS